MKTIPAFDIKADYDRIHHTLPAQKTAPVIGLTGNFREGDCTLAEGYYQSVLKAGGVPFIIPPHEDIDTLEETLSAYLFVITTIKNAGLTVSTMNEKEVYFINNWEAEKYRRSVK